MTVNPERIPTVAELDDILRRLESFRPYLLEFEKNYPAGNRSPRKESYVKLAIAVLAEIGKPTPITVLLERIRQRRDDPTITRGSVETSLLRYLNSKGEKAEVFKPFPGTYALREHVAA